MKYLFILLILSVSFGCNQQADGQIKEKPADTQAKEEPPKEYTYIDSLIILNALAYEDAGILKDAISRELDSLANNPPPVPDTLWPKILEITKVLYESAASVVERYQRCLKLNIGVLEGEKSLVVDTLTAVNKIFLRSEMRESLTVLQSMLTQLESDDTKFIFSPIQAETRAYTGEPYKKFIESYRETINAMIIYCQRKIDKLTD